ncbi:ChaN family lipoprotein [Jannaschia ovalis]|uniref:ChaN family lipoprotein n=1 Tax=Jannaschia ovalis TaxID=3038773 RepID=A0ABY8LFD4_9RHOB|nr:ChaN family lipoprotein [Jannaschia sp. GRR-S6-38]WGH80020.1 ChaN family lipoprotein [Jannaschia sp. GRR-S6-38]
MRGAFGALVALALAGAAGAQTLPELPPAEIYVIGEQHDNPTHHKMQAALVTRIAPTAVVFEMLDADQAARITPGVTRDAATLGPLLDWAESGWPDIAYYAPIMAATDAPILGAAGPADDLSGYGLDAALPDDQQAAREALQAASHCGALPEEILPDFVARQRALDAQFADRTLAALDRYGAPVVLITGNGHARADWGVPAAIARVRPEVAVVTILQGEDGIVPPGGGDLVLDADAPARGDPCDAFR